jgi:hypothetical protein
MNALDRAFFNKVLWNLTHAPLSEETRPLFLRTMEEWRSKSTGAPRGVPGPERTRGDRTECPSCNESLELYGLLPSYCPVCGTRR